MAENGGRMGGFRVCRKRTRQMKQTVKILTKPRCVPKRSKGSQQWQGPENDSR